MEIDGLRIFHFRINQVSMYVDDVNFQMQPNITSFTALVDELNDYSSISGLKLNCEKCTVLRKGSLRVLLWPDS